MAVMYAIFLLKKRIVVRNINTGKNDPNMICITRTFNNEFGVIFKIAAKK